MKPMRRWPSPMRYCVRRAAAARLSTRTVCMSGSAPAVAMAATLISDSTGRPVSNSAQGGSNSSPCIPLRDTPSVSFSNAFLVKLLLARSTSCAPTLAVALNAEYSTSPRNGTCAPV